MNKRNNRSILILFNTSCSNIICCSSDNGKKNGECKEYYENGQLKEICSYTNDKKSGEEKSYWRNGQLMSICKYINGISSEYKLFDCEDYIIRD